MRIHRSEEKDQSKYIYPWNHESDSCPMRANANFIPGIERVPAYEIRSIIYPTESNTFRSYEIRTILLTAEPNTFRSYEIKKSYFILRNLTHSDPMKSN